MQKPKKTLKLVFKANNLSLTKENVDNVLYYMYGIKDTNYIYEYKIHNPKKHVHKIEVKITFNMSKEIMLGIDL